MTSLVAAACGAVVGLVVGFGAGRRSERASQAWSVARSSLLVARYHTGQLAGYAVGAALLLCLAGAALLVAR